MQDECLFCKFQNDKDKIIYQDKFFYSRFDEFPVSPGHVEVIPLRHVIFLLDLTNEEWLGLHIAIKNIIKIIGTTDLKSVYEKLSQNPVNEIAREYLRLILKNPNLSKKPDAYNFGNNDGTAAGRTIDHFHLHIIPRFIGDVIDPKGGIRHIIPGKGNPRLNPLILSSYPQNN